jgi:hypothetical protein
MIICLQSSALLTTIVFGALNMCLYFSAFVIRVWFILETKYFSVVFQDATLSEFMYNR